MSAEASRYLARIAEQEEVIMDLEAELAAKTEELMETEEARDQAQKERDQERAVAQKASDLAREADEERVSLHKALETKTAEFVQIKAQLHDALAKLEQKTEVESISKSTGAGETQEDILSAVLSNPVPKYGSLSRGSYTATKIQQETGAASDDPQLQVRKMYEKMHVYRSQLAKARAANAGLEAQVTAANSATAIAKEELEMIKSSLHQTIDALVTERNALIAQAHAPPPPLPTEPKPDSDAEQAVDVGLEGDDDRVERSSELSSETSGPAEESSLAARLRQALEDAQVTEENLVVRVQRLSSELEETTAERDMLMGALEKNLQTIARLERDNSEFAATLNALRGHPTPTVSHHPSSESDGGEDAAVVTDAPAPVTTSPHPRRKKKRRSRTTRSAPSSQQGRPQQSVVVEPEIPHDDMPYVLRLFSWLSPPSSFTVDRPTLDPAPSGTEFVA